MDMTLPHPRPYALSLLIAAAISSSSCNSGQPRADDGFLGLEAGDEAAIEAIHSGLVDASRNLIVALSPSLRSRALLPIDSPYRTRGFCFALSRCKEQLVGLRVAELSPEERTRLHTVIVRALSSQGYEKVKAIMNRERILEEMEDAHRADPVRYGTVGNSKDSAWSPPVARDPGAYTLAFFGEPGDEQGWGLRFEGHHVSLNLGFRRVDGRLIVAASPWFLGVSPMIVPAAPSGGHYARWRAEEGQQVLQKEVTLARAFVRALDANSKAQALRTQPEGAEVEGADDAPFAARVTASEKRQGLEVRGLKDTPRALFVALFRELLGNHDPRFVDVRVLKERLEGARVSFSGDFDDEYGPLYIRIEAGRALIELLQTDHRGVKSEIAANHIHVVFRDLDGDFAGAEGLRLVTGR